MPTATIQVDDEHFAIERPDGSTAPRYQLAGPASALIVEAAGHAFLPPSLGGDEPNCIQLVLGSDGHYALPWVAGQTRYVLDASTLKPLGASPPFAGLQPGQKGVLGIGHAPADHPEQLSIVWIGMFDVA